MNAELARLSEVPNFKLDYAEIIDEESFENATVDTHKARAIVAGWVEGVRLIDNMAMVRTLVRT
jgi:pantoate--beta-alanine ligase